MLFSKMQVFLSVSGQQSGPFTLLNVYEMKRLGSIPIDTLAWCENEPDWLSLDDFLARHPIKAPSQPSVHRPTTPKSPSRLRGLAGAFLMSIVGGALIAGFTALTGALFTIFWWGLGWANGAVAKRWARTNDQIVGLFAFVATLLGIFISGAGLTVRQNSVIMFGGIGVLICLPGSLWLAFRTASTP
jgi:GYF domain 2